MLSEDLESMDETIWFADELCDSLSDVLCRAAGWAACDRVAACADALCPLFMLTLQAVSREVTRAQNLFLLKRSREVFGALDLYDGWSLDEYMRVHYWAKVGDREPA